MTDSHSDNTRRIAKNLRLLHIEQNGLSDDQIADLKSALPKCTIIFE